MSEREYPCSLAWQGQALSPLSSEPYLSAPLPLGRWITCVLIAPQHLLTDTKQTRLASLFRFLGPSSSFFWFLDLLKDQESSLKTEEKVSREVLTRAPSSIPTLSWGKPAGLSPEVMLVCLASLHFSYLEVTSHLQFCVRASKVTDLGIKHALRLSCE